MASEHKRTAYLCHVPIGISMPMLRSMLNNSNQSDYSIQVDQLKQGLAVLKIFGSGLYYTIYRIL